MTDTPDECRVMAEKIWNAMTDSEVGDNAVGTIENAIRDHTVLPEMVELFDRQTAFMANAMHAIVSQNYDQYIPEIKALFEANKGLGAKCMAILAKARGR